MQENYVQGKVRELYFYLKVMDNFFLVKMIQILVVVVNLVWPLKTYSLLIQVVFLHHDIGIVLADARWSYSTG